MSAGVRQWPLFQWFKCVLVQGNNHYLHDSHACWCKTMTTVWYNRICFCWYFFFKNIYTHVSVIDRITLGCTFLDSIQALIHSCITDSCLWTFGCNLSANDYQKLRRKHYQLRQKKLWTTIEDTCIKVSPDFQFYIYCFYFFLCQEESINTPGWKITAYFALFAGPCH